jgi:hypothetical protein
MPPIRPLLLLLLLLRATCDPDTPSVSSALLSDTSSSFYNAEVYDSMSFEGVGTTMGYVDEVALAVSSPEFFANFKSSAHAPRIYTIFFHFYTSYHNTDSTTPMDVAIQCVDQFSPHLLSKFRRLAAQERLGNPDRRKWRVPVPDPAWRDEDLDGVDDDAIRATEVEASVHVPKFLYELMTVEKAFGVIPGTRGFDGMNIMEIGGGYGGFANTFSEFHDVKSYTVADLGTVNLLIEKYLTATNSKAIKNGRFHTINAIAPYTPPSTPPDIDLIVSFFCISEQSEDVQDEYIHRCARERSKRPAWCAPARARSDRLGAPLLALGATGLVRPCSRSERRAWCGAPARARSDRLGAPCSRSVKLGRPT